MFFIAFSRINNTDCISVLDDMANSLQVIYRYQPIRKLHIWVIIGIGRYGKIHIVHTQYPTQNYLLRYQKPIFRFGASAEIAPKFPVPCASPLFSPVGLGALAYLFIILINNSKYRLNTKQPFFLISRLSFEATLVPSFIFFLSFFLLLLLLLLPERFFLTSNIL